MGCMACERKVDGTTRHFEAPTRSEAVSAADEWWQLQKGLKQTLRLVFPDGDGPATTWNVVIHYEADPSN